MSPDNAAFAVEVLPDVGPDDGCNDCEEGELETGGKDWFETATDRELLIFVARSLNEVLVIANEVKGQAAPVIEKLSSSPIFKLLGGR